MHFNDEEHSAEQHLGLSSNEVAVSQFLTGGGAEELGRLFGEAANKAQARVSTQLTRKRRVTENDLAVTFLEALETELDGKTSQSSVGSLQVSVATHKLQQDEENTGGCDFVGVVRVTHDGDVLLHKIVMVQAKLDRDDGDDHRAKVNNGKVGFPTAVIKAVKKQNQDMSKFVKKPYVLVLGKQQSLVLEGKTVAKASRWQELAGRGVGEWFADVGICPEGEHVDDACLRSCLRLLRTSSSSTRSSPSP